MEEAPMINSNIEERQAPSFFHKHKFTLISVAILVIALIPLVLLSQAHKKSPSSEQAMTPQTQITPTPSVAPLTQQNVQPTLDSTDQQMQQALDDSQAEINAAAQVDTSKDSTAGL